MKIDFVSDVTCPWCAIGLQAIEQAIARLGDTISVDLRLQPFELNPGMPREGEPIADYAARKYGSTPQQLAERQALIRERAAAVGLHFAIRTHVYNTFDAHRLLYWAGLEGRALPLAHALLAAYHERGENPATHAVLLRCAAAAGLDVERARAVLDGDAYAGAVHERVRHWRELGIDSVPSLVVDGRWLIQGAQSSAVYEQALREIAAAREAA